MARCLGVRVNLKIEINILFRRGNCSCQLTNIRTQHTVSIECAVRAQMAHYSAVCLASLFRCAFSHLLCDLATTQNHIERSQPTFLAYVAGQQRTHRKRRSTVKAIKMRLTATQNVYDFGLANIQLPNVEMPNTHKMGKLKKHVNES